MYMSANVDVERFRGHSVKSTFHGRFHGIENTTYDV